MIKEIKLPEVSDNVETGDVIKVLVSVGDEIKIDQPIIELETDKASFEVPASEEGVVKEIKVKQGDIIKIGAVILSVETNGEEKKETDSDKKESKDSEPGEDEKEKSSKEDKEGSSKEDKSEKEDSDSERDSDSTKDPDKNAKDSGKKVKSGEKKTEDKGDEDVKSDKNKESKETDDEDKEEKSDDKKEDKGEVKGKKKESKTDNDEEEPDKKEESKAEDKNEEKDKQTVSKSAAAASPSVRRLARELGVDINSVKSSSEEGRISEDDIKSFVKTKLSGVGGSSAVQRSLPDFSKWGETDTESMSKIRSITADAMTYAWTTVPMVTQFDKADVTALEEFRKKLVKKAGDSGAHITITSILVKICQAALKTFPQFNSSIDLQKKEIIYKKYFNIGVAVDTDRGLLVPVLKNTEDKTITEISQELNELAGKARDKKITPEEMDGGNFTISNLGGIGGTNFTPIVYSPQVAILGVSRGSNEAVFIKDKFEPRTMLPLSLTYDHRIIDGADAARFLRWICEALENPISMLI